MSHFLGTALKELQDLVSEKREFRKSCESVDLHLLIIQGNDFKGKGIGDFF